MRKRIPYKKVEQNFIIKKTEENPEGIRLNKFISNAGICARRKADELIKAGKVSVDGKVVTEMGFRVMSNQEVRFDGKPVRANNKKYYVLLNKPKDFITTTDDEKSRRTVMELIKGSSPERLYPVGRLDRSTTGLLLFTNDGELTQKLSHPSREVKKLYMVQADKVVTNTDLARLAEGVKLDDGIAQADDAAYGSKSDKRIIGIEIHSGKNRVVRRMFEALGYKVEKLDRVMFAGLTKKDLPRGKWRHLDPKEVSLLYK